MSRLTVQQNMTKGGVKSADIGARVIRCGCTPYQKSRVDWHGRTLPDRAPFACPNPRDIEEKGVLAFTHRNPLKRLKFFILRDVLGLTVSRGDIT